MSDETTKHRTADGSPLTPSEIARLDEIEARLEDSDEIPETSDGAWATAVRGKHSAAMQGTVSVRLDADVLDWLRRKGPGYQDEINRLLRERMQAETDV